MRIGMVTACYKPVINGVTRMVALYRQHLENFGHEVTIFTLGKPDPAGDDPGVIRSPGLPLGHTGYYVGVRYTRQAQALLEQMDIIHCHHLFMSVELAHRYAHYPIVYTNHTRYDLYAAAYTPLSFPATRFILRQAWPYFSHRANMVIAPSASVMQVLLAYGLRTPITVIENGIDLQPFHHPPRPQNKTSLGIPENATLLVFVGRLAPEKNIKTLLAQFAQLHARAALNGQAVHLLVVGSGPLTRELSALQATYQLDGYVHLAGAAPYEAVPNLLAAADLFITASVSEVHPLTIIEAMAAGLPVIGVASPGLSDTVISGKTGLLTTTPDTLAEAALPLVLHKAQRQKMSAAARQASYRYNIERTCQLTLKLYKQLLYPTPSYHD